MGRYKEFTIMFSGILFSKTENSTQTPPREMPECFRDLNLDQIFGQISREMSEYGLERYFFMPLTDPDEITYRQDIMKDLENIRIRKAVSDFSGTVSRLGRDMREIRSSIASDPKNDNYLSKGRILEYAEDYCGAVRSLLEEAAGADLRSAGLKAFFAYLREHAESERFEKLEKESAELREKLSEVRYSMLIKNSTIRVRKYEGQEDQTVPILESFEKFRQGDVKDYRRRMSEEPYASHVEAAVLNLVAGLYRETFGELDRFCRDHTDFGDDIVIRFSEEVQFYIIWLEYIRQFQDMGLRFHYPVITEEKKHIYADSCFDMALACRTKEETVTNSFSLDDPERIIVVTGPNQGGKTTFARMFGQIHYLAGLGVSVPGAASVLYVPDRLLTHFEREEDLSTLNGKLQDELVRLGDVLRAASPSCLVIINEIFASTTLKDALMLGGLMMDQLAELGAMAVIVTFLDELALHGEETVSMMSTVPDGDPSQRTFKVIRKAPDGLAYAMHMARKHELTYEQLDRRLKR